MGKPVGQSRRSGEDKSRINNYFFDEGQLQDLENDDIGEDEDAEDVDLEAIDVAIWEKKNRLLVVLQKHILKVL